MNKHVWIAILRSASVILLTATIASAAGETRRSIGSLMREAGFKHKTASWTAIMVQTDESGKKSQSESRMWLSGDQYRMEGKDGQGKKAVIIDDGKDTFMYDPAENKAMKWGQGAEKMFGSFMSSDLAAQSARQRKSAKKVGSEKIDGKPCDIYTYQQTLTVMNNPVTSNVKEWVWVKEGFPLKSIIKTPRSKMKIAFMTSDVPASETVTTVKDLVFDKPVDAALFKLPAGVKVETVELPAGGVPGLGQMPASGRTASSEADEEDPEGEGSESEEDSEAPAVPEEVNKMLKSFF